MHTATANDQLTGNDGERERSSATRLGDWIQWPFRTGLEGGLDLSMLGTGADADRAAMADAEARLAAEVATLRSNPAYAKLDVGMKIEIGRPADHVVEVATREHAERIVVGSHGRRGIERMLLGSVAERIVRLAPCAVLVVKESAGA